jgi:hypothetical protein
MTDQLSLYNGALRLLGQRKLASLAEDSEPRHLLDDVWDEGAIDACLEEGLWNFATRTVRLDYSPSVEPDFGFRRAFDKPADWVRTAGMASDGYFRARLTDEQAKDEAGFWYADLDTIYVRFVSNDSAYGGDLSRWPQSFVNFVECFLALKISPRIVKAANQRQELTRTYQQLLVKARGKDAMNEGTAFPPSGGWVAARRGGRSPRDLGGRGSLVG